MKIFLFPLLVALLACPSISKAQQPAKWIVEPQFTSLEPLGFDLYKIKKDGKYGVIDKDGHRVVDCEFSEIYSFSEGNSLLLKDGRVKAILNSNGIVSEVSEELFLDDNYPYFSEGMLAVKNRRGDWGYIDKRGVIAINNEFKAAYPFSCGRAVVVLDKNGKSCYMHINASGEKSRIGSGFGGYNFFYFASSYVNDNKGSSFALVCIDYFLYKMDINGNMIPGFKLRLTSDPTKNPKREIEASRTIAVRFDAAWRPIMINQRGVKTEYPDAMSESLDRIEMPETNIEPKSSNGAYVICMSGKEVLRNRWEKIIPLGKCVCAVLQSGLYGIVRVNAGMEYAKGINMHPVVLNHYVPFEIEGEILSSPDPDIELYAAPYGNGEYRKVALTGNCFSLSEVKIESVENTKSITTDFYCNANGLEFDLGRYQTDVTFEPAFKAVIPSSGVQDKSGNVNIIIILTNSASTDSGPVDVTVNGFNQKTFDSIAAGQSVNIPLTFPIDMGMEDFKTLRVSGAISEIGCPSISFSGNVTIQRHYTN